MRKQVSALRMELLNERIELSRLRIEPWVEGEAREEREQLRSQQMIQLELQSQTSK